MKKLKPIAIIGLVIAVIVVGGIVAVTQTRAHRHGAAAGVQYYCPMHPTYTSDRPGDCPICNMRLAKRESPTAPAQPGAPRATRPAKDICYMHNCPMVHQGQPCPMLVVAKEGEQVTCPICGAHVAEAATTAESKKILYWTDPMMPGYKSDKPGKSPMGMEMVPVYEEAAGPSTGAASPTGYAPILVTPQKQQLIGIKTTAVERRRLTKTIRTVGRIAYDPDLAVTQQEYLQSLASYEKAKQAPLPEIAAQAAAMVEASRQKLRLLGMSDDQIADLEQTRAAQTNLYLPAPGQSVWVYAQVYEYELGLVRPGIPVTVEAVGFPGETFTGTVRALDPVVDPMTRTVKLRAELPNPDGKLKPEMYVNVTIVADLGTPLVIPTEAVFDTGTKQIVFVDQGQGLFEPRGVVVGAKADGYDGVKRGVAEGERVVTSGNFLIDSESRLKAALEGMSGSSDGGHQHGQ
ncbi:MAG: efflux RND transporter periplasmic adaptor subunit [Candidatus Omnitrophica bacterium]|nr:efflux RND transporter periplasmic adaptor subunit [Candidatus Omnitrophota bacterium]